MLTQVRDVASTMYSSVKPTVATGFVIHSAKFHQQRELGRFFFFFFFLFWRNGLTRFSLTIICLARCWLRNFDDPDLTITTEDSQQPDF